MNGRYVFGIVLLCMAAITAGSFALAGGHVVVFDPRGTISSSELSLMRIALELMLLVVVPVFVLLGAVAWHYRADNTAARYLPNWEHNTIEEVIWWSVPLVIIVTLSIVTWRSTHALDPYASLSATTTPLSVEVISLDWKWLFIYPEQGIATVNYLVLPANAPIDFTITSDAPMNAFFIPQLAGQMMSMPGMETHLNVLATEPGTYIGLSSNYSGEGFAGMQFPVRVVSHEAFATWVGQVQGQGEQLDVRRYETLRAPSTNEPAAFFVLAEPRLYTDVMMRYMMPDVHGAMQHGEARQGMGDESTMHMQ